MSSHVSLTSAFVLADGVLQRGVAVHPDHAEDARPLQPQAQLGRGGLGHLRKVHVRPGGGVDGGAGGEVLELAAAGDVGGAGALAARVVQVHPGVLSEGAAVLWAR